MTVDPRSRVGMALRRILGVEERPLRRACRVGDVEVFRDPSTRCRTWWWRCSNCLCDGYVVDRPRRDAVDAARCHLAGHPVCRPRVYRLLEGQWVRGLGTWWWGVEAWTYVCPSHPEVTRNDAGGYLAWIGPGSAAQVARHHALAHEAPREVT